MAAGYRFVQNYRVCDDIEEEQQCTDFAAAYAKAKEFKARNTDPNVKLRVHVPAFATYEERQRLLYELGVEAI